MPKSEALREDFINHQALPSNESINGKYKMERIFFILGALSAFIGVVAGAFGAHSLEGRLTAEMLKVFEVGVRYQMYHAFALLAVAWAHEKWPSSLVTASGWLFVTGTVLFSGSLYLLSISGVRWLGAITPLGGLAFLVGWFCLAWAVWRRRANQFR